MDLQLIFSCEHSLTPWHAVLIDLGLSDSFLGSFFLPSNMYTFASNGSLEDLLALWTSLYKYILVFIKIAMPGTLQCAIPLLFLLEYYV